MNNIVRFESFDLDVVRLNSELWLNGLQIATCLNLTKNGMKSIFHRHQSEFTPEMTTMIELPTATGPRLTRIYSPRGLALICMLAKTEPAARFRVWALDTLEKQPEPEPIPALPAQTEPRRPLAALSDDAKKVLRYRRMGLSLSETARLVQLGATTVGDISTSLRSFGLLGAQNG